jgi:hypothetical protein
MSRISVPAVESATGATAEVYAEVKKAAGSVPNLFVALGALTPQILKAGHGAWTLFPGVRARSVQRVIEKARTGCAVCDVARCFT